jgi:hypothetical protein
LIDNTEEAVTLGEKSSWWWWITLILKWEHEGMTLYNRTEGERSVTKKRKHVMIISTNREQ